MVRGYKVGDKVRVRRNLRLGQSADGYFVNTDMVKRQGQFGEIIDSFSSYEGGKVFKISLDDRRFTWSKDWLEPAVVTKTQKAKNQEQIRILEEARADIEKQIKKLQEA